jgi:hypothetical protein
LPYLETDDDGSVFVMGYRVAPDCGGSFAEEKIRRCPVALANKVSPIVEAYYRHKNGVLSLEKSYPNPTIALLQGIDVLEYNYKSLERKLHERHLEEIKNGNQ